MTAPVLQGISRGRQLNWTELWKCVHLDAVPRTPGNPEHHIITSATEATPKPLILLSCLKQCLTEYQIKSWSLSSEPFLAIEKAINTEA